MEERLDLRTFSVIIIVVLLVFIGVIGATTHKTQPVVVHTDQSEYHVGAFLKVRVENKLGSSICFSSCTPYYFERNDEGWKPYSYPPCINKDVIVTCVNPSEVKAFELKVPVLGTGSHRLAIPACVGCQLNENFKDTQWFYSNPFTIR